MSGGLHDAADGAGESPPLRVFSGESLLARGGQPVVLRLAVAIRHPFPARADPAALLEPMECGIERAMIDAKDVLGRTLDVRGYGVTVHWTQQQRAEHQHIESSLEQFDAIGGFTRHVLHPCLPD